MSELSPKEKDLLKRVDDNPDLLPLFFKKVIGLKWFDPLAERGYLSPEKNPRPVPAEEEGYFQIPYWLVSDYLVRTAPELADPQNEGYAKKLLELIVSTTRFAIDNEYSNSRTWWQFAKIIQHIPSHLISSSDLEIVDYWLNDRFERSMVATEIGQKWLPVLLANADPDSLRLAKKIIGIIYSVKFVDRDFAGRSTQDAVLRIDKYWTGKITSASAQLAGRTLGRDAVEVFANQLNRVISELDNDSWSTLWQPAIEDHRQNEHREDAENQLVVAFRNALDGYISSDPDGGYEYVRELLVGGKQLFGRIAIHTVTEHFRVCRDLVSELLQERFFEDGYRHEMWRLLESHYGQFSTEEKERARELIGGLSRTDSEGKWSAGATAYLKASWLAAMREHGQKESSQYRDNVEVAGSEPDHPGFTSYMTSGWVQHSSPVPLEEMQSLSLDKLIAHLNEFADKDESFFEPGIEGLSKTLNSVVKASPLQYYTMLSRFVGLDAAYVHQILEAYLDLWTQNVSLPWNDVWEPLLEFCSDVINHESFFSPAYMKKREAFVANRYWIVGTIARLIEGGTRSDDHAFDADLLPLAESILSVLLARVENEKIDENSDAVSVAINSPRGRCLEAHINLSLRLCRMADAANANADHRDVWQRLQPIYDSEINRADDGDYEFVTLFANYLPNFLYMSREWTMDRFACVFDQSNHVKWLSAMQGYSYVGTIYKEVYARLKEGGHFLAALDDEKLNDRVKEQVIRNIVIALFADFEKLEDETSLVSVLIDRADYNELRLLIQIIWGTGRKKDEDVAPKVLKLWPRILDVIDTDTLEGRKLASQLCQWSVFVDSIEGTTRQMLMDLAPFAETAYNADQLLERLAVLSNNQPFEAQEIFLRMLEKANVYYPEEAIKEILANLVAEGDEGVRKAYEIVSFYVKYGNDQPSIWLRTVLEGSAQQTTS